MNPLIYLASYRQIFVYFTYFNKGFNRGSYFIPKKITTSQFVYPKKSLLFLAYPKKSLSPFFATPKNPSVSFRDPKNPGIFQRPKKITFGQNFRPQKNHSYIYIYITFDQKRSSSNVSSKFELTYTTDCF